MISPQLQRLLRSVGLRHYAASVAARLRLAWLITAGAALLLVLLARSLGLLPMQLVLPALLLAPAVPLGLAFLFTRRAAPLAVARLLDLRSDSHELFLTAASVTPDAGEFQPIVIAQAEARAQQIAPARIIPFCWQRGAAQCVLAAACVASAALFAPQFDPFKKQLAREAESRQEQRLRETRRATEIRRTDLAQTSGREAEQVQQLLQQLDKTLKQAKPETNAATLKELSAQQKDLGTMWKKVSHEQLRDTLEKTGQSFGQADAQKLEEWRRQLKSGDVSGLKKEIAAMREQLRQLGAQAPSQEQRALQEQLAQRLNQMANAMKELANSRPLNDALQRALEQMDLSKLGKLSKEATKAAMDSLQLSSDEIEQLSQSIKDGGQLEAALMNLQMAKQLAGQGSLDGENFPTGASLGDYEKLMKEKLTEQGESRSGEASGMGPGLGNGAKRPEDDSAKTAFHAEKSRSLITGGKLLLEWKTSEVGEAGIRSEGYAGALQQVRQGVSEAIEQEQVPPGYHESIKRYFDTLPASR